MFWGEILGVMTWSLGSVGLPTLAISDKADLEMRQMSMQNVSTVRETSILGLMTQTTYCNRQCLLDFPATSEQQDNVTNDIWIVNVECSNFKMWNQYLGRDDPESRQCQPDQPTTSDKLSLVIEYHHICLHLHCTLYRLQLVLLIVTYYAFAIITTIATR